MWSVTDGPLYADAPEEASGDNWRQLEANRGARWQEEVVGGV